MVNPVPIPLPSAEPLVSLASLGHRVWLCDATVIDVRPIQPDDGDRLRRFHARLSPASIRMRYFHLVPVLPDAIVAGFTHVDYLDRMALVATVGGNALDAPDAMNTRDSAPDDTAAQEIVSMVNYERVSADTAEIAFLVEDAWQGKGIASTLLYDLAAYAQPHGFHYFLAITLYRNVAMLNLLRRCGFPCTLRDRGDDEIHALLDITVAPICQLARVSR